MNEFTKTIVEWYKENKRELPWRESADPYLIWISEIILQQTRVAQGYDYFLRFIKRFPDVRTLAAAEEDEVMKYWQGLGYYSRARNLHAAAKSMNGVFPETYPEVLALKVNLSLSTLITKINYETWNRTPTYSYLFCSLFLRLSFSSLCYTKNGYRSNWRRKTNNY